MGTFCCLVAAICKQFRGSEGAPQPPLTSGRWLFSLGTLPSPQGRRSVGCQAQIQAGPRRLQLGAVHTAPAPPERTLQRPARPKDQHAAEISSMGIFGQLYFSFFISFISRDQVRWQVECGPISSPPNYSQNGTRAPLADGPLDCSATPVKRELCFCH